MGKESLLRSALSDILLGYTFVPSNQSYIKHMGLQDNVERERIYDKYYASLQTKGIETEKSLLQKAVSAELWSKEEEREI